MPRFIPRERKHKKLARLNPNSSADSNAAEIIPESRSQREQRRDELKQEILAQQPESNPSRQKRKRLEKYIDTKLRKEENQELLRKLGEQKKVDTRLLRSSKTLGRVRESKRERLSRALRERDVLGLGEEGKGEGVLFEARRFGEGDGEGSGEEGGSDQGSGEEDGRYEEQNGNTISLPSNGVVLPSFGSGLKRPLDANENGQPIIAKRKRRKREHLNGIPTDLQSSLMEDTQDQISSDDQHGEEWHGFSEAEQEPDSEVDDPEDATSDEESEFEAHSDTSLDQTAESNNMPARKSAFKAWASSNMNKALDFTPSADQNGDETSEATQAKVKASFRPRVPSPDPEMVTVNGAMDTSRRAAEAITIRRPAEVEASRLELPVVQEEQRIIETINQNPVTIICGATGSGKTTQIPQLLFENGYTSIAITQPRRVAATSIAARVAYEMGPEYGKKVAHQVRFDSNVSKGTAVKFMTDGILLREIQNDFTLAKYDVVIVDEAHERSVNTDLLIGLLSRIVPLRNQLAAEGGVGDGAVGKRKYTPLRLIIMSATLRIDDFVKNERLFPPHTSPLPPVVQVEGRQFSVTEHFARRTRRDYVGEMVEKVAKGHRKLPAGGMLVFLTGQEEISAVAGRLRERLDGVGSRIGMGRDGMGTDDYEDYQYDDQASNEYLEDEVDDDHMQDDSDADITTTSEADEFAIPADIPTSFKSSKEPLKPHILPLYANLPPSQQQKVFQPPPPGHRLIVLATNVAETSLTIPGIRYVFDCGRSKEKRYDSKTGIQTFEVGWVSKGSAEQRKGRAGRMGEGGHVWRLYSSAVYEREFEEFGVPEILRTPLESVVLQLKDLEGEGLEDIVGIFPFPTPPDTQQLRNAETLLKNLGAIGEGGGITEVGREMMKYPVGARLGKMLVLAKRYNLLPYTIAVVAGLAVDELFIPEARGNGAGGDAGAGDESAIGEEAGGDEGRRHQQYTRAQARLASQSETSDAVKVLTAVCTHAISKEEAGDGPDGGRRFCREHWLREKGMTEVQQLRHQLSSMVDARNESSDLATLSRKPKPEDLERVNQIVAAGFLDQVAIRADLLKDGNAGFGRKPRRAIEVAYRSLIPTTPAIESNVSPEEREIQRSVFIHPSSILAKLSVKEMPHHIVYKHLSRAATATVDGKAKKTRMWPLTAVSARQLAALAEGTPLLEVGKPVGRIEELGGRRRRCWVDVGMRAGKGEMAWPLGAWNVVQKKNSDGTWSVEKVVKR